MKNALRVIIFVLVMGTVSGGLLLGVNTFTASLIAKNDELKLKSSVLEALEIPYDKNRVIKIFDAQVKTINKDIYIYYIALDGSTAFEFRGPGLWGPISGILSLEKDLKTIHKIKITYQEETPGLGSRIAEPDYLKQFKHKEVLPKLVFVAEGTSNQKYDVYVITGATGSSRALEKLINDNLQKYLSALKGN